MESSDTINEGENDLKVLIEKQDTQFRVVTEALKDSLNNLGFALDNSVSKLSKSIDEKIDKLNSKHDSLSLFAPSDVEEELQQEEGDPLRKVMFVVNNTEPQSEGHTDDILC